MGNSLVEFQEKSLWIHDLYLEPIIFFVSKAITKKIDLDEIDIDHQDWFKIYNDKLEDLFMGASDGALDLDFDLLNENTYRLSIVRNILITLYSHLDSMDAKLHREQFSKIGTYSFGSYANWNEPLHTKDLALKVKELLDFIA